MDLDKPAIDLSPTRRLLVLATVIAAATVQNAATFTATAILPQMQGAFAATSDEISWTMTFSLLATAIALPLVGWLVPRFGSRGVLFVSVMVFSAATFLCGVAQSLHELILYRVMQGAAGAALIPLGQVIILDVFPRRQHSVVISLFGVANTVGPVLGPLAGGYLAEHYSWRFAFHMLVPIGIAAGISALLTLPPQRADRRPALDWTGFVSLSVAIAGLQWIVSRGERVDWFQSTEIVVAAWACAVAFWIFVAHVTTTARPFVDLRQLRDRNFAIGLILVIAFGMVSFTPVVLLPPLMQIQMGFPDSDIGTMIAWRGVGIMAGFFGCILLARADQRILIFLGYGAQFVTALWMMTLDLNAALWVLSCNAFLQGLSVGLVWTPISTLTFRTVAADRRPEAMAMFHLVRSVATSVFIAISVAVVVRSTGESYAGLTAGISNFNRALAFPSIVGGWTTESTAGLTALAKEINRQAVMVGHLNAFVIHAVISALAMTLVLFVPAEKRG
ncbi:MAG: DHA2 family efflux MFS transporter permease subunit [Gammaproteobacteria bacterium]|nr:DHA2 family efflux MFS transporter permease subunit [Gammaproteobacteria bacterium]